MSGPTKYHVESIVSKEESEWLYIEGRRLGLNVSQFIKKLVSEAKEVSELEE